MWLLKPVDAEWKARIRAVFHRPPVGSDNLPRYGDGSGQREFLDEFLAAGFFSGAIPMSSLDDMLRETDAWKEGE